MERSTEALATDLLGLHPDTPREQGACFLAALLVSRVSLGRYLQAGDTLPLVVELQRFVPGDCSKYLSLLCLTLHISLRYLWALEGLEA